MTNQNAENQPQNNSTDNQNSVNLFCTTLDRLNKIGENQMKALLNLAITAANSVQSGEANGQQSMDKINSEIHGFAADLKNAVKELSENTAQTGETEAEAVRQVNLTNQTEMALVNAIRNSVSLQQQLNVLGQAILAKGADLVLTTAQAE